MDIEQETRGADVAVWDEGADAVIARVNGMIRIVGPVTPEMGRLFEREIQKRDAT